MVNVRIAQGLAAAVYAVLGLMLMLHADTDAWRQVAGVAALGVAAGCTALAFAQGRAPRALRSARPWTALSFAGLAAGQAVLGGPIVLVCALAALAGGAAVLSIRDLRAD